jgi:phosphohistidine swiveling domain-containing protein
LSDKSLIKLHGRLYKLQYLSHGWALPTTWFVDSDGEDFTKYLLGLLKDKITPQTAVDLASAFSILTTIGRRSFNTQEEQESLKILQFIKSNRQLKKWFISHTTSELIEQFNKLPVLARRRLYKHFLKWCWFPYTYLGPAYNLDYYLEVWRGLLHEDINPQQELTQLNNKAKLIKQKRKQLISKLRLSKQDKHLFDIAAEIIWLKGYRKDCYFHGFYALDFILAEIAKRVGLSLLQTKYLLPKELPLVLRGRDLTGLANKRMKFCVIYFSKGKLKVITGVKAKYLLKRQKIEKEKKIKLNNLLGTCACPGKAKGIAKIINVPEDIPKMKSGNIMISHTTFPSLVPAMKKAAAIVTEDGGITCHAAIVARELQTPCLVGCSGILKAVKDGNVVEVDATNGTIKKIS